MCLWVAATAEERERVRHRVARVMRSCLVGLAFASGAGVAQDTKPDKARFLADAYRAKMADCSCTLRVTPDVAVDALLAIAIADTHCISDRVVWSLRTAGASFARGLPTKRVAAVADRRVACGVAYTPVWGDKRAVELEILAARLIGVGLDPWQGVPADLRRTGIGLWGKHAGVHVGLSPMPGGLADEKSALDVWRERCRGDDLAVALDTGGVVGVLLFRCLQADAKTEAALLESVRHSRSWRYDPLALPLKWATPSPEPALFAGDSNQWQAVHAVARRLLELNKRLRDLPSADLERRMRPKSAQFVSYLVGWLERLLPLFAAAATDGKWPPDLARELDALLQPVVPLSRDLRKGHRLGVVEDWDASYFSARIVAR